MDRGIAYLVVQSFNCRRPKDVGGDIGFGLVPAPAGVLATGPDQQPGHPPIAGCSLMLSHARDQLIVNRELLVSGVGSPD